MIKLFRKIRQKLLSENKFTRYLVYATGEIILVVIGILIALGVNQRSQNKANEEKVETIFEAILKDLSADIVESDQIFYTIHVVDSISHKILEKSVKIKTENTLEFEVGILNFTNLFNFTYGGYQNLSQNLDIVPKKYDSILNKLHQHYNAYKESVEYWDNRVNELTKENSNFLVNSFDWYNDPSSYAKHQVELINNKQYKNRLFLFRRINTAWLNSVSRYRKSCTDLYQSIAKILEKPVVDNSFKFNKTIANLFLGEWKEASGKNLPNVLFTYQDGRMYIEVNRSKRELYVLKAKLNDSIKEVQIVSENDFFHQKFEGNTMILSIYNIDTNKVDVFKYVKTKE